MLQYLQRIGKAIMLPIAALPVAGILLGVGWSLINIAALENAPAIYQPLIAFVNIPMITIILKIMQIKTKMRKQQILRNGGEFDYPPHY